jgi:probable rRNA maturation factor
VREAAQAARPLQAHCAHLLVHGTLHAQGFDHQRAAPARRMEALETAILLSLGLDDPYAG